MLCSAEVKSVSCNVYSQEYIRDKSMQPGICACIYNDNDAANVTSCMVSISVLS